MLKYVAGAALLLAGCEPAEARCERLRMDILIADLSAKHRDEDWQVAREFAAAHAGTDSARYWQARADSLLKAHSASKVKMTDRSWYRQHCQ